MPTPYISGRPPLRVEPLARYLPPLPDGVAATWLDSHLPGDLAAQVRPWILDPFGTSPRLAVEAARAGYRVLVAANNPIARFLYEMAANPPTRDDLRAALAELASARRGEERMEPHIRSLYLTRCEACGAEVMAEAFIWERGATGSLSVGPDGEPRSSTPRPVARIYQCLHCNEGGERTLTPGDIALVNQFSSTGLHKARALERVAASDDPDRRNAEEALEAYLPRAVYALFTLINKLDALNLPPERRDQVCALLLAACDQANTLWPHPSGRARPRQLTIPPRFRENNVWMALEQAVELWSRDGEALPLARWPAQPPPQGGICIFEGRLRDLVTSLPEVPVEAVVTALPRPNQAFWTLSALWAGWLWGREAVGPFKNVLRRRRYDWSWHSAALHSALGNLARALPDQTPVFALIGEAEPGFLSASLIAADMGGYQLEGLALRADIYQAQINWKSSSRLEKPASDSLEPAAIIRQAVRQYLSQRGEPASYLQIHSAALAALAHEHTFSAASQPPADALSALTRTLEETLSYRQGFLRFGGSDKTLDAGLWWARDLEALETPLADRLEIELVGYLVKHPNSTPAQIDQVICKAFPETLTPGSDQVQLCLESYAQEQPPGSGNWSLRPQDTPNGRRSDLQEIRKTLGDIARRMGLEPKGDHPQIWLDSQGELRYAFYTLASAMIGELIFERQYPPTRSLIVLPGGRANLVAYKLQRDPRLRQAVEEGWRFVKYRQLRWLAENPALKIETLDELLAQDSLTYDAPQLRLF